MRLLFLNVCMMAVFCGAVYSQDLADAPVVPYKEFLSQVLDYYPSLKKENASVEKVIAQKALTASGRMPQFWASVQSEYGNDPVYVFGALLRQNTFTSQDFAVKRLNNPSPRLDLSGEISGEWLLFDFSQTASRIKSAGILVESAQFQAEMTRMEAILAAAEIFSRLVATDSILKVLEEQTSLGQNDILFAESLQNEGLSLGADFYLARMTQTQLLQLRNETVAQRAALAMVFNVLRGKDPCVPVRVKTGLGDIRAIKGTIQDWIQKAIEGRLDIKIIGKVLEASKEQAGIDKNNYVPKISAYGRAADHRENLGDGGGDHFMVGIKAKMDFFDPGYRSRVKLANEEVDRLSFEYQERKDHAAQDVAETYYRLQAMEMNTQLARNTFQDVTKAVELITPLYREGRRSIADMLSLRFQTVAAMDHVLKLENIHRQSVLTIKFYAGELTPADAEVIYGE